MTNSRLSLALGRVATSPSPASAGGRLTRNSRWPSWSAIAVGATLAGCGGSPARDAPTVRGERATPAAIESPAATALVLADLRVMGPEGVVVALRTDGSVIVDGNVIGILGTDGRFVAPGDDVVAVLGADGTLRGRGRRMATIAGDAVATLHGGEQMRFGADGTLSWHLSDLVLRLEPADSPAERAALMLIILLLTAPA